MRAVYREGEQILREEDPYPFRRSYRVGQTIVLDSINYCIVATHQDGNTYTVIVHRVPDSMLECHEHSRPQ